MPVTPPRATHSASACVSVCASRWARGGWHDAEPESEHAASHYLTKHHLTTANVQVYLVLLAIATNNVNT